MRANSSEITLPPFPRGLPWLNVGMLKAHEQRGHAVLVEFWDFCRINSLRTLPYLKAWHERYAEHGLRVVGIHTGGFECSRDPEAIEQAVTRLGIEHPVLVDSELEVWDLYGNQGWPARYLWTPDEQHLFSLHYGEGAYAETEREIGELLRLDVEPLPPVRPEDAPDAVLAPQTADQPGLYTGPYEAGGVHVVCAGAGAVDEVAVDGCGVYTVRDHPRHTTGVLELGVRGDVEVLQTCFTPGLA